MMSKTIKKSYEELLDDLGEALMDRGELDVRLTELCQEKKMLKKMARRAKWFSEDRYSKWADFYACRAEIEHVKKIINGNNRKIDALENRIAAFGIPTPSADTPSEAEVVTPEHDGPAVTYFSEADLAEAKDSE